MLATVRSGVTAALVLALFGLYGTLPGTGPWTRNVIAGVRVLYEKRNSSRDARGASILGDAYTVIRRVAEKTAPGSRILIPSGRRYDPVSNRVWSAYYLYPRHVLVERDLAGPLKGSVDYVVAYHGWYLDRAGLPGDSTTNALIEVANLPDPAEPVAPAPEPR